MDVLPPYLSMLNQEQKEAVLHKGASLLILAGAGSGKTRVITTKIAYLIREWGMDPRSVLAVTFTNKAAREMAERAKLIDERASDAMLRTFHSFGAWFLRRNGSFLGLDSGFVIYDEDDTVSLLASLMDDAPRSEMRHIAHNISLAKDFFLGPEDPDLDLIDHRPAFRNTYARYEERMKEIGNVDFGDLIKKPVEILKASPEIAKRFHERFKVILVDEYQDSNIAQFELLKELKGSETYVCVVGDDDQSIYRFRGADVRNILEFPERFAETSIIRLEQNYRSTSPILELASEVVDHNQGRLGKKLRSVRGPGKLPDLAYLPDQDSESAYCAGLIAESVMKGAAYSDWAILYRTNSQSLGFETTFLRKGIPYRVVGSLKFYEREEIKDVLALLSFIVNTKDEVAFRRVVNKPARGVGKVSVDRIVEESGGGDLAAASEALMHSLPAKARAGLKVFLSVIRNARKALDDGGGRSGGASGVSRVPDKKNEASFADNDEMPAEIKKALRAGMGLSSCVAYAAKNAGIVEYHYSQDDAGREQRIANLQELANAASLYEASLDGLLQFLENIELDRAIEDTADARDAVTLITLHNTKGLEFKRVVITGLEQGIFPWEESERDDLEEERRLFYVGATRAMDELYLTSCARRRRFGRTEDMKPSIFLKEIGPEHINVQRKSFYGFSPERFSPDMPVQRRYSAGRPPAGDASFAPRSFAPRSFAPRSGGKRSSDGRWTVGDMVFHDDRGYGEIVDIAEGEEGPEVRVRFETGGETRFLSEYQSSRYVKIKGEI